MLDFQKVNTVGIFGDWHSNTDYALKLLNRIDKKTEVPDVFMHLGDFNFFPDNRGQKFLNVINSQLDILGRELFVLDGNHEDFDYIKTFKNSDKYPGFKEVREHIFYIPRGLGWTWGGKKFVAVGGAWSVDYAYRKLGESWFLEENITDSDVENALKNKKADYFFSHDSIVSLPYDAYFGGARDFRTEAANYDNREKLQKIVSALKPKYAFHGHHHVFNVENFRNQTVSVGVNKDNSPFGENYVILNIKKDKVFLQFNKMWAGKKTL